MRVVPTLALLLLATVTLRAPAAPPAPGLERFYIGTFTSGTSKGIYQSSLDLGAATFSPTNLVATNNDPSFIALSPDRRFLYSVNEGVAMVSAYAVNPTNGNLTFLNSQPSHGGSPCHIVVDATGKNVIVANYTGGSIAMYPVLTNGALGVTNAFFQHPPTAPHAHCATIDASNHFVFVCDLGLNQIRSYVLNPALGTLVTNHPHITPVTTGAGPRHLAFDPQFKRAYLICELNSTIVAFNYNPTNGTLAPFQTNSTLPAGYMGGNSTAEIVVHPSGRFVYGSNRGHNSVAVFAVNPTNGTLSLVQHQTVGTTPRNFAIDPTGAFCIVANQDSNNILLYSINPTTGQLTNTGSSLTVSKPVCILPFIIQPPQPVLRIQSTNNAFQLSLTNALDLLTYQIYEAPTLVTGMSWNLFTTGTRGQTNFTLTNALAQNFFRAAVLTNY